MRGWTGSLWGTSEQPLETMQRGEDFGQRSLQRNQGRLSKCSQCGKSFAHRSLLLIHRKLHKGNGSHLCFLCGKSFPGVWSFAKHLRSHPGVKAYKCGECGEQGGRLWPKVPSEESGETLQMLPVREILCSPVPPFDPPEAAHGEWIPPVFSLWEILSWSLELCQTSPEPPWSEALQMRRVRGRLLKAQTLEPISKSTREERDLRNPGSTGEDFLRDG
ncbi:hypothetical protein E2320_014365, partial [Naja naja]